MDEDDKLFDDALEAVSVEFDKILDKLINLVPPDTKLRESQVFRMAGLFTAMASDCSQHGYSLWELAAKKRGEIEDDPDLEDDDSDLVDPQVH